MKNGNGLWKKLGVSVAGVTALSGFIWSVDTRYAKSVELAEHKVDHTQAARTFTAELLESRAYNLRRDIFELEQAKQRRRLTLEEERRLEELREEYGLLNERIRGLRR